MTIEDVARIAHEANRAYCLTIGDTSQEPWDLAPKWQRESAINGVLFHLKNRDSKPSDSHESWLEEKYTNGWKYGPVKDPEKKEHPCCVPYNELPKEQQAKDYVFLGIVRACEKFVTE